MMATTAESNGDYDVAAFSPASSVASSASAMSLSADASPVPSPADSTTSESTTTSECGGSGPYSIAQPQSEMGHNCSLGSSSGKRKQAWEGGDALDNDKRRRVAPAAAVGKTSSSSAMPRPTHKPEYNEQLQGQFETAVESGSHEELDRLLSSHSEKIDIDRYGLDGRTPLQAACGRGSLALAKLLVAYGADATRTTKEGWSTLHIASYAGNHQMLAYIRQCSSRR